VLIECAAQLSPESREIYMDTYGPNGSCWNVGAAQWQQCRDACVTTLEALNQIAMASGESCGTCTLLGDCAAFGPTAYCNQGFCAGGDTPEDSNADDETVGSGPETGDGDGDDATDEGDGDGSPTTDEGDGDGEPTTDEGDGDGEPTTDEGDGDGEPTTDEGDGDGDPQTSCGWDAGFAYYACGGEGEDPNGENPIECPPGLVDGAACGEVTGIGCCDQNGDNWYCGDDGNSTFLVVEDCP
jgi:hypothetical protein